MLSSTTRTLIGGTDISRRLVDVDKEDAWLSMGDFLLRLAGLDGRGDDVRGGGVATRWDAVSIGRGGVGRG